MEKVKFHPFQQYQLDPSLELLELLWLAHSTLYAYFSLILIEEFHFNLVYFLQVKTQLQSQSSQSIAVGFQHHHDGFLSAFRKLSQSGGLRGMWRGATASMMRTGIGSGAQLSTFSKSREAINNLNVNLFKVSHDPHIHPFIFILGVSSQLLEVNPSSVDAQRSCSYYLHDAGGRRINSFIQSIN